MDGKTSDQSTDEPDDVGLSLEELSETYARMMDAGQIPYESSEHRESVDQTPPIDQPTFDPLADELVESDQCPITPLSILEAIMFVGRPDGKPTTASEVAALMRGVRPAEVDDLVEELNEQYRQGENAMRIMPSGGGYRMELDESVKGVFQRFYGKSRQVRLGQNAIDCLALVAYQPGISREEIDNQRGEASGAILNQLVRRQLLEMRREGEAKKRLKRYYPTQRMLALTGLNSLEELPQVEDWE